MELEAAAGEVAVDDPVCIGDVAPAPREPVPREVVVVRPQLAEHRLRTWSRQALAQSCRLPERDLHARPTRRRQHSDEVHRPGDHGAVRPGLGRGQPAGGERPFHGRPRCALAGNGPRIGTMGCGCARHYQHGDNRERQPGETPHTHHAN